MQGTYAGGGTPENSFERRLLSLVRGAEVPLSRLDIIAQTGYSDRYVRKTIENLRRKGWPIVSTSKGEGYSYSSDPEEVQHIVVELRTRASDLWMTSIVLEDTRKRLAA